MRALMASALSIGLAAAVGLSLATCSDDDKGDPPAGTDSSYQGILVAAAPEVSGGLKARVLPHPETKPGAKWLELFIQVQGAPLVFLGGDLADGKFAVSSDAWVFEGTLTEGTFEGTFERKAIGGVPAARGLFAGVLDPGQQTKTFRGSYSGDQQGVLGLVQAKGVAAGVMDGPISAHLRGTASGSSQSLKLTGVGASAGLAGTASGQAGADGTEVSGSWEATDEQGTQSKGTTHVQTVTYQDTCDFHTCGEPCGEEEVCVKEMGGCVPDFLKNFGVKGQCAYAPHLLDMFHCDPDDERGACASGAMAPFVCFCGGCSCDKKCYAEVTVKSTKAYNAWASCWDSCQADLTCEQACEAAFDAAQKAYEEGARTCAASCGGCLQDTVTCWDACTTIDCREACGRQHCPDWNHACIDACEDTSLSCVDKCSTGGDQETACENDCETREAECEVKCLGCSMPPSP